MFEIKKKLIKNKIEENKIKTSMEFIRKKSLVIELNGEIAEKAVEVSIKHELPIIDSLIYTTAILHHADLITLDNDFRGLKDVLVL